MSRRYDVVIVGGGPVGAALALALAGSRLAVLLLEGRADPVAAADPRPIALSYASALLLRRLGAWEGLGAPTPIEAIEVSTRGSFGRSLLTAREAGVPALGHVADYRGLCAALQQALRARGVEARYGAPATALRTDEHGATIGFGQEGRSEEVEAGLAILADGGRLVAGVEGIALETCDYGQWAVAAEIGCDTPHRNTAFERFTAKGPVALLPQGARSGFALVWTTAPEEAQALLAQDEAAFLARLQERFGTRAGRFTAAAQRAGFPLVLRRARPPVAQRVALIGNAAQTLHPVAGQGFNLGLRDAWELAEDLRRCAPGEAGAAAMLDRYRARRWLDRRAGVAATDALVRLFSNADPLLAAARGAGLTLLDLAPPVRRFFARRMIFGARG